MPDHIDLRYEAMKRLKKSYERFLYMVAKYPLQNGNGFIPPTYARTIELYAADCILLVDYVMYHSPWPVIKDDTMRRAHDQTNNIWKDEFEANIMTDHLYNTIGDTCDDYHKNYE